MKRRLFVGIDVPTSAKSTLFKYSKSLTEQYSEFKVEPEQKLHLTLKFLGSTTVAPEKILTVLQNKLSDQTSFSLALTKPSIFVHTSTLLIVDVEKSEELLRTYHKVNNELENLGFKRERRAFHPHLTLARSKKTVLSILGMSDKVLNLISWPVTAITLFESKLTRAGSCYTKRGEVHF